MKKQLLFLITCSLLLLGMNSCQNGYTYSCDPELDAWAKGNIVHIQNMTRADYLTLDYERQRTAYVVMSARQRYLLWQEKINEVLALEWNEMERGHLNSLLTYLDATPSLFDDSYEDDSFYVFAYKWEEYAIETLGWDKKIVYLICGSPNPVVKEEQNGISRMMFSDASGTHMTKLPAVKAASEGGGSGSSCGCSRTSDYCDIFGETMGVVACRTYNCRVIVKKCGFMLKFDCDGVCRGIGV